jgi:AraC family transcriptional regulator of adaptative response/methylated-DNA-[protein]-cysteine methyltransferase
MPQTLRAPQTGYFPAVTQSTLTDETRYAAVVARDASLDGAFFYAVRTTGVYCKPSCASRTPKRENVSFHDSQAAAEAAGFRACQRCHPEAGWIDLHTDIVTAACRLIDEAIAAERPTPTLEALAAHTGFSPYHLHRVFRKVTGITPRAYAAGVRAMRMRQTLEDRRTITAALHDAGYSSTSRFYEQSTQRLGMTPARVRSGGVGETVRFAVGQTSLGAILVAATEKGICTIHIGDDPERLVHALEERFPKATLVGDDAAFAGIVAKVVGFVESPRDGLDLPLDIRGTAFQERVWTALRNIEFGRTITYSELAEAIGQPTAVRAVASACAANEIAMAIPCHRVVRATGELSGYRWGIERKAAILQREGAR